MNVTPAGDRALLLEPGPIPAAALHGAAAVVRKVPGVLACVPGAETLLVVCRAAPPADEIVAAATGAPAGSSEAARHEIRVSFAEAADLEEFLAMHHLTREQLMARVSTVRLTARYLGFRAGFAYLEGWPEELAMPRRATSRRVPRGSFAIAGTTAGFYPIDTPGGWNLLGRTDADLWEERRDPPNLIAAGDRITIVPTLEALEPPPLRPAASTQTALDWAEIVAAPLARVVGAEDWSRVAHGIAPGGPFDDVAAALVRRATSGSDDAAILECAMTGPRLRFTRDGYASWYGATAEVRVNGLPIGDSRLFAVRAGDALAVGPLRGGLRGYLGFGTTAGVVASVDRGDRHRVEVLRGPHQAPLHSFTCEVTPQIDRVGLRLQPIEPLPLQPPAALPSIGMQCGTIQLHPDGSVVVMGPDHPVTGGYLQPLTVLSPERWKLAQLMPGERVTFVVR